MTQTSTKKQGLLDRWRAKSERETKTIKFDGEEIVIREMVYAEKEKLAKFEDSKKISYFVWSTCIAPVNPDLELFEQEFVAMLNLNSAEIGAIVDEALSFSGVGTKAAELLEKN